MKHKNKIKKNKPKTKHEGKNEENGKNRSQRMVEKSIKIFKRKMFTSY